MNTNTANEFQSQNEENQNDQQHGGFAAGTLVHTKEGLKPIETLQVGDWVLSFPEDQRSPDRFREEHEYTYRQIRKVGTRNEKQLCKIVVANLGSGNKETLMVSSNQGIWCKGSNWTPLSAIDIAGDVLENYRYRNLVVFRCLQNVEVGTVYNFEVDEYHTYYVGEEGIWVHDTADNVGRAQPTPPSQH